MSHKLDFLADDSEQLEENKTPEQHVRDASIPSLNRMLDHFKF